MGNASSSNRPPPPATPPQPPTPTPTDIEGEDGGQSITPSKKASAYEPHHEVVAEYPCPDLLKADEGLTMYKPNSAAKRYEPLPLVPDPAVEATFPQSQHSDCSFTSLYKTNSVFEETFEATDNLSDVSRCTAYVGRTTLRMVTYLRFNDEPDLQQHQLGGHPNLRIRIARSTEFWTGNGQSMSTQTTTYETDMASYVDSNSANSDADDWSQENVMALLIQNEDRAARHVKLRMDHLNLTYDMLYGEYPWLPPRTLPIEHGIRKLGNVLHKTQLAAYNQQQPVDDQIDHCPTCLDQYEDEDSEVSHVILLRCSMKHSNCHGCILDWGKKNELDSVRCMYCAQRLATPNVLAQLVPNYFDMNGTFHNDPRYTAYENFERSCADLDRQLARDSQVEITVDAKVLGGVWQFLIAHSPLSSPGFTTIMTLQVTDDFEILHTSFLATIRKHHGQTMEVGVLQRLIVNAVVKAILAEMSYTGLDRFFDQQTVELMEQDPKHIPQREGFPLFLEKSINRVLNFYVVPKCSEEHEPTPGPKNIKGYHYHGDRIFWGGKCS